MTSIVPQMNGGLIHTVFMAEAAQAGRVEHQRSADNCFHPNPTRGQHSEKVATREKQNVAGDSAYSLHYAVCPRSNVFWRFAPRAAVAEQLPVRAFCKDVSRVAAFVLAIVPFDQVTVNLGHGSKPSQFARLHGPTQRTGKHLRKCHPVQTLTKLVRIALSVLGER